MSRVASGSAVSLEGVGLHSGKYCSVTISHAPYGVWLEQGSWRAERRRFQIGRADRGVCVTAVGTGIEVDLVEHLFSALGGLGIHTGVTLRVEGPEVPLLDGGARDFCAALAHWPRRGTPGLRVERAGSVEVGASLYQLTPGDAVGLCVHVNFAPLAPQDAHWDGSPESFTARIAPARTFGFARDAAELRRVGRATHVDVKSVLLFDDQGCPLGCVPEPDELARHKLLDLIGDLYLFGGPPLGTIEAWRPGHAATHHAMSIAMERGLLQRSYAVQR